MLLESESFFDLIDEDLLLGCSCKRVDIRYNDCNNEIDHDEGAKDDEANEEGHGEEQGQEVLLPGAVIQSVKFKFSKNQDNSLQQRFARVPEVFIVAAKADDEECKAKSNDHDDKGNCTLNDSLGDGVEHDAESKKWRTKSNERPIKYQPPSKERISANHEDDLNPCKTDSSRGHNIENL